MMYTTTTKRKRKYNQKIEKSKALEPKTKSRAKQINLKFLLEKLSHPLPPRNPQNTGKPGQNET